MDMGAEMQDEPEDELHTYVASLVQCLQWDPSVDSDGEAKRDFTDALTEISALPAGSLDMEVRRLLVVADEGAHLDRVVAALRSRDVFLKCKAANAVGSLCTSRVAGQRLLDTHGGAILQSVGRMAATKNTWAQADAFYVLGWVVVIADESVLQQSLVKLIPVAIRALQRNLDQKRKRQQELPPQPATEPTTGHAASEQDTNLRIYTLVFLLNFSQRDVFALSSQLQPLLVMLQLLITHLGEAGSQTNTETAPADAMSTAEAKSVMLVLGDPAESIEVARLVVTLLSIVADRLEQAPQLLVELQARPILLKLQQWIADSSLGDMVPAGEREHLVETLQVVIDTATASESR